MPLTPSRVVLIGLVAFAMVCVAYPAAYFLLVRKQLTVGTVSSHISGGASWPIVWSVATPPTATAISFLGPPSAPSLLLSPHYGAALGLPDGGCAQTALGYLFLPAHECDRQFVRAHDWSVASIFGCTKPGPPSWYAVKSHP